MLSPAESKAATADLRDATQLRDEDRLFIAGECDIESIPGYLNAQGYASESIFVQAAKIAAKRDGSDLASCITSFGIENQEALLEIARIAARDRYFSEHVANFGLQDEKARCELAKIAMSVKAADVCENIGAYGITDQSQLIEIAKAAALDDRSDFPEHVANFGISDPDVRFELAMICAKNDAGATARHIASYAIDDPERRIELAKIAAANSGGATSENIANFEITDRAALVEIAKIAAAQSFAFCDHIGEYGITDRETILELARIAFTEGEARPWQIEAFDLDETARIEIAKFSAAASYDFSQSIADFRIEDEAERIAIAKIAATHGVGSLTRHIADYAISDISVIEEIACIAAAHDGGQVSRNLENFGIENPDAIVRIAKTAATYGGPDFGEYLEHYGITDRQTLLELAKTYAANNGRAAEHIGKFKIKKEADRIEVARLAIGHSAGSAVQHFENFRIRDGKVAIELARAAASEAGIQTSKHIGQFGITDQRALVDIATIAIDENPYAAHDIKKYGIESQSDLVEIAKRSASRRPSMTCSLIRDYGIESEQARAEILTVATLKDPDSFACLNSFDLSEETLGQTLATVFTEWQAEWRTTRSPQILFKMERFLQLLAESDGLEEYIDKFSAARGGNFENDTPAWKLNNVVMALRATVPGFDDSLFSYQAEIQSEETIYAALAATILTWDALGVEQPGSIRSRLALRAVSGLDTCPIESLSSNTTRTLYGAIFDSMRFEQRPIGERISIAEDCWKDPNKACNFLVTVGAIAAFSGEGSTSTWNIDATGLDMALQTAEHELNTRFSEAVGLDKIHDGVAKLQRQWGDITSFAVLMGRYTKNPEWKEECSVVSEIAAQVLDGSFFERKYNAKQLAMLDGRGKAEWQKNPCEIALVQAGSGAAAQSEVLQKVREIFETNLILNMPEKLAAEARTISVDDKSLDALVTLPDRQFRLAVDSLPRAAAYLRRLLDRDDRAGLQNFMQRFSSCKQDLLGAVEDEVIRRQLSNDLKSMSDVLKRSRKSAPGKEYVVFSTVTDDPKLLLTIGDLVNTASCQNYRTGSHIDTLPAYVIDGNIKAALSFVIPAHELSDTLRAKINQGKLKMDFDAPRLRLTLTDESTGESQAFELGKAVRRNILRLGTNVAEDPVLLPERAYLQPHAVEDKIEAMQDRLIAGFTTAVGAKRPEGSCEYPASDNPGGVYTDAGAGKKKGEYTIHHSSPVLEDADV